ncbi:MAG TPA: cytochrome c family protein [Caulobacteraceae bacterium]|jgi:cytochrome c|nr:cytochrome c family protein [Caulobacteraceae bacterium]
MRTAVLTLAAAALALAACGQSSSSSSSQTAAPAQATPDQVKTLLAELPAPYNAGDVENGKIKFTQCAACHTTAQGGPNLTGPNLHGIFGRKAGTQDGFAYSDALKSAGWTWDAGRIDTWIANPHAVLPTTKMSFPGLKDPKDRIDVIAYLKTATSPLP